LTINLLIQYKYWQNIWKPLEFDKSIIKLYFYQILKVIVRLQ